MIQVGGHLPSSNRSLLLLGCVFIFCLLAFVLSSSIDAADPRPEVRQIFVPADKPSLWPKGNWLPISADEYRAFLKAVKPAESGPQSVRVEQMNYSAVLVGNTLRNGTLTGRVHSTKNKRELLFLEPLNLAVSQLRWSDQEGREAVWGAVVDGRTAILVDRIEGELQGRWTFQGRGLPHNVQFDLQLMPATVSRIRLQLPQNQVLKSSAGDVRGPLPSQQAGWNDWQINLGSQTRCHLTITETTEQHTTAPVLFCEQNTSYIVRQADLQFQVDLNLEVFEASVQQLSLSLPVESEVYSVTYGSDTTLERKQSRLTPDSTEQLTIQLPDPLLGKGRTIRIRGITPVDFDKRWNLPKITLNNSIFTAGQFVLRVASPLELRTFNANGYRQIDTDTDAVEGQILTFDQLALDASINVNVGYRNLELSSQAFTFVDAGSESWNLECEIHWQARSGSTFMAECKIPPEWEITDVRSSSESSESELADWGVQQQGKQDRRLLLHFRESLNPESPKSLLIFARRLPVSPNQQLPVPVIEPLNCDDMNSLLSLAHPTSSTLILDPGSTFEMIEQDDLSESWKNAGLWKQIESAEKTVSFLFNANRQKQTGSLRLHVTQQPVEANVVVNLELQSDKVTERFVVRCLPSNAAIRRLLVYLTSSGPSAQWKLLDGLNTQLEARTLPRSQHEEWNLPAYGELWEIILPFPHKRLFRIGMSRTRLFPGNDDPAIALVPSARQFSGTVLLDVANDVVADIETQGLQPLESMGNMSAVRRQRPQTASRRLAWSYESAADDLKLQIHTRDTSRKLRALATVELDSLILTQADGYDSHRARFRLDNETNRDEFRFKLPDPAELIAVSVDGQRVVPTQTAQFYVIPPSQQESIKFVEIQYRTPSQSGFVQNSRTLVVPQVPQTVLNLTWRFAFSPHMQLMSVSPELRLRTTTSEASWVEQLFGPLGRHTETAMFNPFDTKSWRSLFTDSQETVHQVADNEQQPFAPAGWTVHKATMPNLPTSLAIQLANHGRIQLLAWQGFLLSLITGLILRIRRSPIRHRIGMYWIGLCLVVFLFIPSVYAEIVGGCFMGAIIAILLPNILLSPWKLSESQQKGLSVGLGSTETIQKMPATLLLLFVLLFVPAAFAQESSKTISNAGEIQDEKNSDSQLQFDVLIPVRSEEPKTLEKTTVVYVTSSFVKYFRDRAVSASQVDLQYLISSIQYNGMVEEQPAVTFTASLIVVPLTSEPNVRVMLPFTNPNFGGTDACRVNDQRHPILHDAQENVFFVELVNDGTAKTFKIDLVLHPPTTAISGGGTFEVGVPRVPSSSLTLRFSRKMSTIKLVGARGEIVVSGDEQSVTAQLGKTDKLKILWSASELPAAIPPSYEAKISYFVDVQAGWLQYRIRVDYENFEGRLDFVAWQLPPAAIVREVTSDDSVTYFLEKTDGKNTRLLLQFSKPRVEDFSVEAVVTLPIQSTAEQVTLPKFDLLEADSNGEDQKVLLTQIGLTTVSGLELELLTKDNEDVNSIEADAFMEAWGESETSRRPEVAYRLQSPVELKFRIVPLVAVREIRQSQVGRIGRGRLDWTLTAEIETTTAPAFQHTLKLDSRLRIDSISVVEDEAERLVRWSRFRDRLVLFLGGKTTGIQSLVLKAHLPVSRLQLVELPVISFDDAEIVDSRLTLYHDAALDAELVNTDGLLPVVATVDSSSPNQGEKLLGRFRLSKAESLPNVRIGQHNEKLPVESVTLLQPLSDDRYRLSTVFRFRNVNKTPKSFRLRMPGEIVGNYQVHPENLPHREEMMADGSVDLVIEPTVSIDRSSFVTVTTELTASQKGEWKIPAISVLQNEMEKYIVLLSTDILRPVMLEDAETQQAELPKWVHEVEGLEIEFDHVKIFRSTAESWTVSVTRLRQSVMKPECPLVDTKIWIGRDGKMNGRTGIYLLSPRDENIEISWPSNMSLHALFIDGQPVDSGKPDADILSIPIQNDSAMHTVTLFWISDGQNNLPRLGSITKKIPLPANVDTNRVILTVSPTSTVRMKSRTGWEQIDSIEKSLDYLDGLLDVNRHSFEADGTVFPSAWKKLVDGHQLLRQHFKSSFNRENTEESAYRKRYSVIAEQIELLREKSDPETLKTDAGLGNDVEQIAFASEPTDSSNVIYGRLSAGAANPSVAFWVVDYRFVRIGLAVITLLIAIPVIRRLQRLEFSDLFFTHITDWVSEHIAIVWVLLGLVWWVYLTPSFVGFVLFLVAIAMTVRKRFGTRSYRTIILDA